jgi:hypothetical protein
MSRLTQRLDAGVGITAGIRFARFVPELRLPVHSPCVRHFSTAPGVG